MFPLLLPCAGRSTAGMFVCPAGSLPSESWGQCTPQVASVPPPPGNDVGDVTDTAQLMFLVILPGGKNYLSRTILRFCILLLAVPVRSHLGIMLCTPVCGNQGWRHQHYVLALVLKWTLHQTPLQNWIVFNKYYLLYVFLTNLLKQKPLWT